MFTRAHRNPSFQFIFAAALILEFSCTRIDAPLRIGIGQTITHDLAATDGRGVLRFEGESGQVLMVNRADPEHSVLDQKADKLILVPPLARESERIPMSKDDGPGYRVGPLTRTGIYELFLRRPSSKPYRLRLTLMDAHDPGLDPGISPDRVSFDATPWATVSTLSPQPFDPPTFDGREDNWPAHP